MVIGNENYYRLPQAVYAYNDASAMMEFMKNTRVTKYRMTYLQNGKQEDLEKALSKYYRRTSRKGTLWIYFLDMDTQIKMAIGITSSRCKPK